VNIATVAELAADAIGDRVAIGPAAGGLRYTDIRRMACAAAGALAPAAGDVLAYVGAGTTACLRRRSPSWRPGWAPRWRSGMNSI
jgi:hypothetical protein